MCRTVSRSVTRVASARTQKAGTSTRTRKAGTPTRTQKAGLSPRPKTDLRTERRHEMFSDRSHRRSVSRSGKKPPHRTPGRQARPLAPGRQVCPHDPNRFAPRTPPRDAQGQGAPQICSRFRQGVAISCTQMAGMFHHTKTDLRTEAATGCSGTGSSADLFTLPAGSRHLTHPRR